MGRIGCVRRENPDVTSWQELSQQLHQFTLFCIEFHAMRNDPKCIRTLCNTLKHEFRVQWGGLGAFVVKNPYVTFVARTFALIAPVHPVLHRVSCSYKTILNASQHYATHQNISLGSNGVDWLFWLKKKPDVILWHVLLH